MIQRLIQEKWFQLVKTLFVSRDVLEMTGVLRRSIHNCHTAILQVNVLLEYISVLYVYNQLYNKFYYSASWDEIIATA